jgi:hypothetical protein
MPRPLYPWGRRPRYPSDRRLDELQGRSGLYGGEKNLASVGNEWMDGVLIK